MPHGYGSLFWEVCISDVTSAYLSWEKGLYMLASFSLL